MSSCSTMGGIYGLRTPEYLGVPIVEGPSAEVVANQMGIWRNDNTLIRATTTKNVYLVHLHNGKEVQAHLKPLPELLVNMPEGCTMFGVPRPHWDTFYETLCWRIQTYGRHKVVLLYSGGTARGIK